MSYAFICETLGLDPGIRKLSDAAFRTYICAVVFSFKKPCAKSATPWRTEDGSLRHFGPSSGRKRNLILRELFDAGFLKKRPDGYLTLVPWSFSRDWKDAAKAAKRREANRRRSVLRRALLLEALSEQGRLICNYCRCDLRPECTHVDHVVPISRNGSNALSNLVLSCARCNLAKGAKEITNG